MKSVRVRSFSGPYFPAFGLNTEIYSASIRIQSTYGKNGTEKLRIRTFFTPCEFKVKEFGFKFCGKFEMGQSIQEWTKQKFVEDSLFF